MDNSTTWRQWIACLGLVALAGSLVGCLGSNSAEDEATQAASAGQGGSQLRRIFDGAKVGDLVDMDARYMEVGENMSEFSMANFGEGGQAQYFQESRFWGNGESSLGTQESSLGSQRAFDSNKESAWGNRRFAGADEESAAPESSREFATSDFADGTREFARDGEMSSLDGRRAPSDGRSYRETQRSLQEPRLPNIIRNLQHGGYVGEEQVRALTQ